MTTFKPHCSVDYHNFNGTDLDLKAKLVAEGIYTNDPPFTSPPYTQTAFNLLVTDHHDKYDAYKNGGQGQKGAYSTARTSLITAMDKTGDYVDERPGVDNDMILLAGFTPTKTGETKSVIPPPPGGITLSLGITGEMFSICDAITGETFYGSILVAGKPLPENFSINNAGQVIIMGDKTEPTTTVTEVKEGVTFILDLTKQRRKHYRGLTKGVDYYCYYFAVNSAGVSPLSGPVVLMCG